MKKVTWILFLLGLVTLMSQSPMAYAKGNPLLICLGDEEEKLHLAKITGPLYRLNQLFINQFASANDVQLRDDFYKEICVDKKFAPSVNLLRLLLLKGQHIFKLDGLDLHQRSMTDDLSERAAYIFFSYLGDLQGHTAHAQCLPNKIPEIKYFSERFQYLEGNQSSRAILEDQKKIQIIFDKLQRYDEMAKECQKEKIEMDKKLLKGTGEKPKTTP